MNVTEKKIFITDWIKDYVNNMPNKAQSLVIGISGGIDSSVSSTLCAMTDLKTIAVSMPRKQKSDRNVIAVCVFKKSPAGFEPAALRLHCRHRDDALKSLMLYRLS